jgi:hypothetical protein
VKAPKGLYKLNIDRALEGAPVVTREGLPVTRITRHESPIYGYPYKMRGYISLPVPGDTQLTWFAQLEWAEDGSFDVTLPEHRWDVFMTTRKAKPSK